MKHPLNWIFLLLIYLSVNGQVFSTPVHICQAMATNNYASLKSSASIKIHEHHQMKYSSVDDEQANNDQHSLLAMKSCHCVDCDCSKNFIGQANNYLAYSLILISSIKKDAVFIEGEPFFLSQPHPNLFRPPIQS
jgi:hypothetical protein